MKSNNSSLTGILLLVLLWMGYMYVMSPDQEEVKKQQQEQQEQIQQQIEKDSLSEVKRIQDSLARAAIQNDTTLTQQQKDSIEQQTVQNQLSGQFGNFAIAAANKNEGTTVLQNDKLIITVSNKGGQITKVEVPGFKQYVHETEDPYDLEQLVLMNNANDRFRYIIPMSNTERGDIATDELYFEPTLSGNTLTMRAYSNDKSQYVEQVYTLAEGSYLLDYKLNLKGINRTMPRGQNVQLDWATYVAKIEKNPYYEKTMTTVYYKEDGDFDYCDCRQDDQEDLAAPVQWISHSQQFFNTSLMTTNGTKINNASAITKVVPDDASHLKELYTIANLEAKDTDLASYDFQLYIGPNDYNELVAVGNGLEEIIPFGWSIFGFISRSIIRPIFNVFAMFIGNYGIIVLLLTLLIRLVLFPLQYKMLLNGVKMSVLKPELEKMKEKYKDDKQGMQMAQMKLYGDYGVSPLGGCLPMMMTMPIWIALYRFFPASISFRQESFLWADDLVSYDSIWDFGYVPFIYNIYGDHVSLFTLLWMISMFAFLWYNSKQMDMSAAAGNSQQMKMMKYMQFAFPVLFFFALNSWAAALTAYMLFSNIFNIAQTYITKNILIDKEKLKADMEKKKLEKAAQPAKAGMFSKYQEMLQEQQRLQQEQQKKKKKK